MLRLQEKNLIKFLASIALAACTTPVVQRTCGATLLDAKHGADGAYCRILT